MKVAQKITTLLAFALIAIALQPEQVRADSRVYLGFDLGGIVAAFDIGPRYVHYGPPVAYERWPSWRPGPPPYPPPRSHVRQPPPRWSSRDHQRDHQRPQSWHRPRR